MSNDDLLKEIEARKKVEEAFRESEEKFHMIFDNSAAAIMFADAHERLRSWNKFTERLLGMGPEDLNGKPIQFLYPPEAWEKIRLMNIREAGIAEHCETVMLRKDGSTFDADISLSVLKDAQGKVTGSIGIARDISERKKMEAEIQKKVDEAVEKLARAESQLYHTEKMNALGELTAGIIHEINQPLNVMKIICQQTLRDINREQSSMEEIKKDLPEIVSQINRLTEIIAHMRNFSRRNDEDSVRKILDLQAVVLSALKFMRVLFNDQHIELVESYSAGFSCVKVDPVQIEQVCMNLLNNARHAVEKSSSVRKSRVEIKTYLAPDGKQVVLEVADNGIGIPENFKPKIFQSFFTTKEPGKGTGLGLSLCRRIMEAHDGRIEFDSREGEGATFRVFFPIIAPDRDVTSQGPLEERGSA